METSKCTRLVVRNRNFNSNDFVFALVFKRPRLGDVLTQKLFPNYYKTIQMQISYGWTEEGVVAEIVAERRGDSPINPNSFRLPNLFSPDCKTRSNSSAFLYPPGRKKKTVVCSRSYETKSLSGQLDVN